VFGSSADSIPVSSTKSMHGHLLGAAGALEFAATVMSMQRSIVPPTINLDRPDPACDLDYVPNVARAHTFSAAMSSSFAFGGTCACLIARLPG
jgi:3-oxoacyl-(acyl-carrier-protein) synthase